ncbi:MAG: NAD-binding protein [Saprospiraceae bacterium]|nr:NAD-binding protein [Saprospiraceae bacterium]
MSLPFKRIDGYRVPGNFLNLRVAIALLLGEVAAGIIGFAYLEGYSFQEGLYMTIITISTVGYTEVRPLSDSGQLFATILILVNIGIFAYLLAAFSYYVVQGEVFRKWHLRLITKEINKLKDHVIICGYGRHGREIVDHFMIHNTPCVVIENEHDRIEQVQNSEKKILYIEGDATYDDTLREAGVQHARALITALPDDADNVLITLSAKQLNPDIKVISRASDPATEAKLQRAGANHVVLPEQIGGFFMATLVNKPGAIEFLSFVTNEKNMIDIAFEELRYEDLPQSCRDITIGDLNIGPTTGTHIIGFIRPDGSFIVNPDGSETVVPGSSMITLGTRKQLNQLKTYLEAFRHDAGQGSEGKAR